MCWPGRSASSRRPRTDVAAPDDRPPRRRSACPGVLLALPKPRLGRLIACPGEVRPELGADTVHDGAPMAHREQTRRLVNRFAAGAASDARRRDHATGPAARHGAGAPERASAPRAEGLDGHGQVDRGRAGDHSSMCQPSGVTIAGTAGSCSAGTPPGWLSCSRVPRTPALCISAIVFGAGGGGGGGHATPRGWCRRRRTVASRTR